MNSSGGVVVEEEDSTYIRGGGRYFVVVLFFSAIFIFYCRNCSVDSLTTIFSLVQRLMPRRVVGKSVN